MPVDNIETAFKSNTNYFQNTGFPNAYLLKYLSEQMSSIYTSLGLKQVESKKSEPKWTHISFDPDGIEYRQKIIKILHEKKGLASDKYSNFKRGLNDGSSIELLKQLNALKSEVPHQFNVDDKYFENLCVALSGLYNLSGEYIRVFDDLSFDPTYKVLKRRNTGIKRQFDSLIKTIDSVNDIDAFHIDAKKGTIIPILDGSKVRGQKIYVKNSIFKLEGTIEPKKIARKAITDLYYDMIQELRHELLGRIRGEMFIEKPILGDESKNGPPMFALFRDLAKPVVLFEAYKNYINSYKIEPKEEFDHEDDFRVKDLSSFQFVYPEFSDRFDVKQMFPMAFAPKYSLLGQDYVPLSDYVSIDLETGPNERKIAFVGLNSGGKSTTLENLEMAECVGSMGLPLPAQKVILPKCNRLIYYNNSKRGSRGKLETEIRDVAKIIKNTEKNDLIIIDNFFEGGTPQITTYIAHKYMDAITDTDARVILESHAPLDLDHFEDRGWITFVPEYIVKRKKIKPTYRLKRGRPDQKIMMRYATEMADRFLISKEDNDEE